MRVIAITADEVGVVLSKSDAAVLTAALGQQHIHTLPHLVDHLYPGKASTLDLQSVMPMFDWLRKWVDGR